MNRDLIKILGLDDDETMLMELKNLLEENGLSIELFDSPDKLLNHLEDDVYIIITDQLFRNHGMDGIDVVQKVLEKRPACYFIMISGLNIPEVILRFNHSTIYGRYLLKNDKDFKVKLIRFINDYYNHYSFMEKLILKMDDVEKNADKLDEILKRKGNGN